MESQDQTQKQAVMMIEVSLSRQPRAYQSIRVGVSLPVFVTPEDDIMAVLEDNLVAAKFTLEAQVDEEFESYDEPAPYSREPRYMLAIIREMKLGAIVPHLNSDKLPGGWKFASTYETGHRLIYVRKKAVQDWPEYNIIDASDGNLEQLPAVERYVLTTSKQAGFTLLFKDGDKFEGQKAYPGYFSSNYHLGTLESVLNKAIREAADWELPFFDCTDGDFSRLPAPPIAEPEPDDEDELPYEDDDDDYRDDDNE